MILNPDRNEVELLRRVIAMRTRGLEGSEPASSTQLGRTYSLIIRSICNLLGHLGENFHSQPKKILCHNSSRGYYILKFPYSDVTSLTLVVPLQHVLSWFHLVCYGSSMRIVQATPVACASSVWFVGSGTPSGSNADLIFRHMNGVKCIGVEFRELMGRL